ncbi:MAG TPA: UDP-4-amino-4,6-dideoxy-N-acetyl-beta-L-altrosamine transaminase [Daejeonella sp.]|uniref:UDP-4-amino-4, 6-dideoxy-N-acetyl-beta-L-altrosamine transaminase n=1 Tax=Daejeonella sp. TaxID=2805397 RepID=UPI002EDA3B9F
MIPYGRQYITEEDVEEVIKALRSDFMTQGPAIKTFEENFAKYIGARYAVAISNGTAALHLSALALNLGPGDKVITSPITFAASANCVRYCGADVVFADIDPKTYLLDIAKVEALLQASPKGTYKGIIPVDFAGRAVDLQAFKKLANEYDCWLIEDACHAPGAYFTDNDRVQQNSGNGAFADLAIFSFHPVKHIATGEGGMITTNDEKLYNKLLMLRTHGITRNSDLFKNDPSFATGQESDSYPGWYMEMQTLGFNYRITDFQSALGSSQLKRADSGLKRRREIASRYNEFFSDKSYIRGHSGNVEGHAYHLYVIETQDRLGLYNYLRERDIFPQVHYIPCHLMPYYRDLGWKEGDLPLAEQYYRQCLSLPMYPTLSDDEQEFVIASIRDYFNN